MFEAKRDAATIVHGIARPARKYSSAACFCFLDLSAA